MSRFHFAFSYSRWTPRSSAVCPIWGSLLHLMSHSIHGPCFKARARCTPEKKSFTEDRVYSSTACHSRHLRSSRECDEVSSLRWWQWNHLPGRQHCNSGGSDDASPSIWRELGGLSIHYVGVDCKTYEVSLSRYSLGGFKCFSSQGHDAI